MKSRNGAAGDCNEAEREDLAREAAQAIAGLEAERDAAITARTLFAAEITRLTGQEAVVDNKPGAEGQIGAQAAATAPPDGYTIFVTTQTTQSINQHVYKRLLYDPVKSFEPISGLSGFSTTGYYPAVIDEGLSGGKYYSLPVAGANSIALIYNIAMFKAAHLTPPTTWAAMKTGADDGAIPAKVLENIRPIVIAGLAKLADEVKK